MLSVEASSFTGPVNKLYREWSWRGTSPGCVKKSSIWTLNQNFLFYPSILLLQRYLSLFWSSVDRRCRRKELAKRREEIRSLSRHPWCQLKTIIRLVVGVPNVTASFERCHWLHLNAFLPQGGKHLKCLRGFMRWRCLLLSLTSVSSPLVCGSVHTPFWSHAPRCILLWKLEEIAIWVLKHKIKMPFYCACLWGIGLEPQFRQLCVYSAI